MVNRARKFWAAVETEHRSEGTARRSAEAVGVQVCFLQYRAWPRAGVRQILPLFQGYIIVRLETGKASGLSSCRGVKSVVRVGDCVGRIPDDEIEYFQSLIGDDGYVQLDRENPPAFALHDAVTATAGAFADQVGDYRGIDQSNSRRAMVAFQFMGREAVSSIFRYDLARA
jgi:transcription antitermination factor NusG